MGEAHPWFLLGDPIIILRGNKHGGEPLEKVASEDPDYLRWLRKWVAQGKTYLSDQEFYALDDVMVKHQIPID